MTGGQISAEKTDSESIFYDDVENRSRPVD